MTTRTIKGAAYWASYLINGDASGMTDREIKVCDDWHTRELGPGELIVDCSEEPEFSWAYWLHTGDTFEGGELLDYTVLKI